jgi:hypothetical protein
VDGSGRAHLLNERVASPQRGEQVFGKVEMHIHIDMLPPLRTAYRNRLQASVLHVTVEI